MTDQHRLRRIYLVLEVMPPKRSSLGVSQLGPNLSAVISHLYRDDNISPPLTGVYLSIPSVFRPEVVPERYRDQYHSLEQNADAPVLGKGSMDLFASKCSTL